MDSAEQKAGEGRVQAYLIDPLNGIGLMRPGGMKVAAFDEMLKGLRQRLAYMTEVDLRALAETVEMNPAGSAKDRWPAGPWILDRAREISPPAPGASPLIRSVFKHRFGAAALREGWAPELLENVRKTRRFPTEDVVNFVRSQARNDMDRAAGLRRRAERGEAMSDGDTRWLALRDERQATCQAIADEVAA